MAVCGPGVIFAGANQRWALAHFEPGLQATSSHPSVTAGDVVGPVPPVFLVFLVEWLFYWRDRVREGESQRVSIIRRIEAAFFHLLFCLETDTVLPVHLGGGPGQVRGEPRIPVDRAMQEKVPDPRPHPEIGRASCRERG